MKTKPNKCNVFLVGFMKSGTTALADFLSQHPEICVSIPKEPGTFATDKMKESDKFHGKKKYFKIRTNQEYSSIFSHASKETRILIDASTAYIYSKEAAKNIHDYNPEAKIIIMIREPISFLRSLHAQYLNETVENIEDFKEAILSSSKRKKGGNVPGRVRAPSYLYYWDRINYAEQVKRYLEVFPKNNIKIIFHDDFVKDNANIYTDVLKFIGADIGFSPKFSTVHGSSRPRSKILNNTINSPAFKNVLYKVLGRRFYMWVTVNVYKKYLFSTSSKDEIDSEFYKNLYSVAEKETRKLEKLVDEPLLVRWGYQQTNSD